MFSLGTNRIPWALTSTIREVLILLVGGSLLSQLFLGLRGESGALFQGRASSQAAVSSVPVEAVHFRLDASDPGTLAQIEFRLPAGLESQAASTRLYAGVGEGVRLPCWDPEGDGNWTCAAGGVSVADFQNLRVELE